MVRVRHPLLCVSAASLVLISACTSPANLSSGSDPNKNTRQGAILGGLLGAGVGALVSDDRAKGAVIGGAVGAGTGALVGNSLDKQEAELRQQLANRSIVINNTGDRLIVTMPNGILFPVGSAVVNDGVRGDILVVANSLQRYPNSRVQVLGHTDNTGGADLNQSLSERRANSVAFVMTDGGVAQSRIQTIGRGEDQPIASNLTDAGRAQNRRVEIVILPTG